ncbi:hypothetical protein OTBS_0809 [Orientia tsutsugamushi str. Boryong]|uniref:Transmembrane protein n=1 Tax=Orientia tsutsugamushi (strain Boryong) TaxID=357244 RepID=A5CDF3_ORITB|nr:hypothetical protein OTBS_0809 [Orientia tsutsugamushi str. Boryong]
MSSFFAPPSILAYRHFNATFIYVYQVFLRYSTLIHLLIFFSYFWFCFHVGKRFFYNYSRIFSYNNSLPLLKFQNVSLLVPELDFDLAKCIFQILSYIFSLFYQDDLFLYNDLLIYIFYTNFLLCLLLYQILLRQHYNFFLH